jgi:AmmeMemoRadiSam system protein B/AmmeMemoRadiSam system protein A
VRPAALAGSWYQGSADSLRAEVGRYLEKAAGPEKRGTPMALIVPHAGHRWSGQAAAYAYKSVQGKSFRRIFVLAPNHRVPLSGAAVPEATAFATPLGEIPLDTEVAEKLAGQPGIAMDDRPHGPEHSIEIQLPFLQVALKPGFKLVPVLVGEITAAEARQLADKIRPWVGADDLVLASSDFTHYGANFGYYPFRDDVENNLKKLDFGALDEIRKLSPEGLAAYKARTGITACGHNPIMVLLALLPSSSEVALMHYDTSGRQTGDFSSSVSYLAVGFYGAGWPEKEKEQAGPADLPEVEAVGGPTVLSPHEQQLSLKLARSVVETYVRTRHKLQPEQVGIRPTATMREEYGVFVTLHKHGQLRGCIGNIWPVEPLVNGLVNRAVDAAVNDSRFTPVTPDELPELEVEISVLTKPKRVDSYRDIVIGKHGMVVKKLGRSAVYLPQVAPEQGWNLQQTLSHLSLKARLPQDAWRQGAEFEVFEAQVFKEAGR